MKLIMGLGNPGPQYHQTKHNAGYLALDLLAQELGIKKWHESSKAKALYAQTEFNGEIIELVKPLNYMNNSGQTLQYILAKHHLFPTDILIIHDDLDLPLGEIRIGVFDSAGGHKGIQDIIQQTKMKDFLRYRIGIKTPKLARIPADKYVLSKFSFLERIKLKPSLERIKQAILCTLEESLTKAMNKYN